MDEIEEIKRKIDIVDFISGYLTVKKAGANFRSLCPFHHEKSPSMMISPEKQIFKCFGCFVKGTPVITETGLKSINEIIQDEKILTHQGRLKRVLTTFKRLYRGQIIELRTRQTSEIVRLTPDHKVFMIRTQNCKQKARQTRLCQSHCSQNCPTKYFKDYKIEKLPISEASVGDYLIYPVDQKEKDLKTVKLYDYDEYFKKRTVKTGFPGFRIPECVKVDQDFLKFLGYWIAEGSTYTRGVRFSLGSHEKDFALEISKLAKNIFGLTAGIHERSIKRSGIEVSISNIHLAEIMIRLCGHGAAHKKMPEFCLNLPKEKQKILIEAMFKGDGTTTKKFSKSRAGRKSITTISNQLTYQIKDLLLRIGFVPVTTLSAEHTDLKNVHHRPAYTISWMPGLINNYTDFLPVNGDLTYWLTPIKALKRENFSGNVYNLMVEDDSSYVVKNFAVGNCGEGGDVFSFVMKMENLEFREALEMLALRAGVKLEKYRQSPNYQQEKDEKTKLYEINAWSARLFHEILTKHPAGKTALAYLKNRGLSDETIEHFTIGYAPSNAILKPFLMKKGYTATEIQAVGGPDRFFKRIIFPIRDVMGNVLGFTGRVLEKVNPPDGGPKYLNTPETIIFHKGRILYNLDKARGDIKLAKSTVVVEGQMDVVSSVQAGVKNVVATSGTALTEDHLRTLYRYTPNIIFSFDSDTAGLATAKKAYEMAIAEGMNVKMVNLGDFKDPGEMVEKDALLWPKAIEEAQPVIDWYFRLAFKRFMTNDDVVLTSQDKKEIAKELIPIIKKIPDTIEQAHYVGVLAHKLGVAEQVIFEALGKVQDTPRQSSGQARDKKQTDNPKKIQPSSEEILVGLLVLAPDNIKLAQDQISADDLLDSWSKLLYNEIIIWYNLVEKGKIDAYLKEKLSQKDYEKLSFLMIELENDYPDFTQVITDICLSLKAHKNEKIKQHYATAIAQAEEKGDREKLKQLVKEFQDVISK